MAVRFVARVLRTMRLQERLRGFVRREIQEATRSLKGEILDKVDNLSNY